MTPRGRVSTMIRALQMFIIQGESLRGHSVAESFSRKGLTVSLKNSWRPLAESNKAKMRKAEAHQRVFVKLRRECFR
jgi:hypothetical protein